MMSRPLLLTLAWVTFVTLAIGADDPPVPKRGDPVAAELEVAKQKYRAAFEAARKKVLEAFAEADKAVAEDKTLKPAEKLKRLDQLDKERVAFTSAGTLPKAVALKMAVDTYQMELKAARSDCDKAFEAAADQYVKTDRKAAKAVLDAKPEFLKNPSMAPAPAAVAETRTKAEAKTEPAEKPAAIPPTSKPAADSRRVWTFSTGKFEVQADGSWLETKNDGKRFEFNETRRTAEFIELSSKTQIVIVRLYSDTSDIQRNNGPFKHLFKGGWNQ